MKNIRVIARLDIKGPNLVKGVHLEGLRVLGKPEHFARYYYEHGADELIYMDIVASLYGRNSILPIIEKAAQETFIPMTVGGGLRTLADIRKVLLVGADKVSINTAAINNPEFIKEAARRFGSSTIVVTIEAIKQEDGSYHAFTDNGREYTGREVISWARQAAELGAGEILLTSVDQEGAGKGFDLELTKEVSEAVGIPVIAHGGAGKLEHIHDVITQGKADAVSLASILHYDLIQNHRLDADYSEEGNIEFLKSKEVFTTIKSTNIQQVKNILYAEGVQCRHQFKDELQEV